MSAIQSLINERRHSNASEIIDVSKDVSNFAKLMHISSQATRENKIPKIIHKIWWQGLENVPEKYVKPFDSWAALHESWVIAIWDETSINTLIAEFFPKYEQLVSSYGMMIQKIDAAKYFMLAKVGGCYSDMDQFCINPIDSVVVPDNEAADIICSVLTEKRSLICVTSSFRFLKGPYMNNAFIVSKAGAPHWQYVFEELKLEQFYARAHLMDEIRVLNTTGPVCFTRGITEAQKHIDYKGHESVRLLPSSIIDPFSIYFKFGKEKNFAELLQYIIDKDEAICISYEPSAWVTGKHWYGGIMKTLIHWRYRHDIRHIKHDTKSSLKPKQGSSSLECGGDSVDSDEEVSSSEAHTALLSPESKLSKWIKEQKTKFQKLASWMQELDKVQQEQLANAGKVKNKASTTTCEEGTVHNNLENKQLDLNKEHRDQLATVDVSNNDNDN